MKTQLIIPNKLKVGFNLRPDTYSGKLGYVIYHDGKIWRKETSWEGWRQKEGQQLHDGYELDANGQYPKDESGKTIYIQKFKTINGVEPLFCDNVPTEGFVLNKKVGGYKSDWNVRETKARVFDPRGFEFEIDIPNLLYILQETNSIKGKGLEGEFVYAWDGKELVLLPTCSPDYQSCINFTKIQSNKVASKSLIPGASYLTKQEEQFTYLGRFNWYEFAYVKLKDKNGKINRYKLKESKEEKFHMFYDENHKLHILSSLSNISNVISDIPVNNYADLIEEFKKQKFAHKVVGLVDIPTPIQVPVIDLNRNQSYHGNNQIDGFWFKKHADNEYIKYSIYRNIDSKWNHKLNKYEHTPLGFTLYHDYVVKFENGKLTQTTIEKENSTNRYGTERVSSIVNGENELLRMNLQNLSVKFENDTDMDYKTYCGGY